MQRESNKFESGSTYTAVLVNGRICDQTKIDWNTEMPMNSFEMSIYYGGSIYEYNHDTVPNVLAYTTVSPICQAPLYVR